jgi:GNAT superfamily N-acetyltransferase
MRPMTPVTIRPMEDADLERVAVLSGQLGYPVDRPTLERCVRRIQAMPDHAVYVAVIPEIGVAGWTHVHTVHTVDSGSYAEIGALVVDARCRRLGAGRALVREVERWARGRGLERLRVRSNVLRPESHQFYPGVGLERIKTQHVYGRSL